MNDMITKKQWLIEALNTALIKDRREDYKQYLEKWERKHAYDVPHNPKQLPPQSLPYEVFKYTHPRYDWDKAKEIFKQYRELED